MEANRSLRLLTQSLVSDKTKQSKACWTNNVVMWSKMLKYPLVLRQHSQQYTSGSKPELCMVTIHDVVPIHYRPSECVRSSHDLWEGRMDLTYTWMPAQFPVKSGSSLFERPFLAWHCDQNKQIKFHGPLVLFWHYFDDGPILKFMHRWWWMIFQSLAVELCRPRTRKVGMLPKVPSR